MCSQSSHRLLYQSLLNSKKWNVSQRKLNRCNICRTLSLSWQLSVQYACLSWSAQRSYLASMCSVKGALKRVWTLNGNAPCVDSCHQELSNLKSQKNWSSKLRKWLSLVSGSSVSNKSLSMTRSKSKGQQGLLRKKRRALLPLQQTLSRKLTSSRTILMATS